MTSAFSVKGFINQKGVFLSVSAVYSHDLLFVLSPLQSFYVNKVSFHWTNLATIFLVF